MTREERLKFCSVCTNRAFNPKQGMICGITNEVASFEGTCADYKEDAREVVIEDRKKQGVIGETNKSLNKGRYALFIVAGLYVIVGYMEAYVILGHELLFGIIDWSIAAIFIGLGIWSYYKAFLAMVIGLGLYVLINLLLAWAEPSSLFSGIIWKAIVITYLVYGIKTAREEEKKQKPVSDDLLDQI
jgi:hypothetical protein